MAKKIEIAKAESASIQPLENIENLIHVIRGKQVMLDVDLARLYGVETKRLNEQVKRNLERFPEDFMFQLSKEEIDFLRSQIATIENGDMRGRHVKYKPYAFTEKFKSWKHIFHFGTYAWACKKSLPTAQTFRVVQHTVPSMT